MLLGFIIGMFVGLVAGAMIIALVSAGKGGDDDGE